MQSQMTDSQLQAIQDRDAEIAQLEVSDPRVTDSKSFKTQSFLTDFQEDMMNVNDIFRDLNQQISQQGEIMGNDMMHRKCS